MFLQRPCETPDELFDREEELNLATRSLKMGAWIAILGPRMSGKTSVAKVSANMLKAEGYIPIYVDLIGVGGWREAAERILSAIPRRLLDGLRELRGYLEAAGVKLGAEITLTPRAKATSILEKLFQELSAREKLIVVLDEAQEVRGGAGHMLSLLHRLRMSSRGIGFIFTGSAIGMMRSLLNPPTSSPLYGRSPVRVELKPWSTRVAERYLSKGLEECGAPHSASEVEEVVKRLGTLPGWLSFYGLRRCLGKSHSEALKASLTEAIGVARAELRGVLAGRGPWAAKALRMLSMGARWSELLRETGASRRALSRLLQTLKTLYLISEEDGLYVIPDPNYRRAARRLRPTYLT